MGRGGRGLLGGLAVELSGKGAIGRGAGQGRKMAPRGSFRSPQHLTSEHLARYLSITVAKRAHWATAVSPGMNLQDSSRDQSVARRCRAGTGEIQMIARVAILIASLLATAPAMAQSMNAEAAQRFVTGKLFGFSCFEGSRGVGQIYSDGSVTGTIQVSGSGPVRSFGLPPGTFKVKGEAVCATLKGLSFEPCFNLNRTGEQSFRASLTGFGSFAHCDFDRRLNSAGLREAR